MFVITGATGHLGRHVIEHLLKKVPADQIVAAVRSPERAADIAERGVEVREADYDRPETLATAFEGAEKLLLISGSEVGQRVPQHTAAIDAAKAAGVRHLLYTGALGGPDADFTLADEHKATELAILGSGLTYTFLRNGWYNENYTERLGTVLEHNAVVGAAGDGRVASATREDYAEAAVAVLTGEGHENRAYELSGDVAWSFAEYATAVAALSGKPVTYQNVPADDYAKILIGAGLPEPLADILADVEVAVSRGLLAGTTGDLTRLIGRPTTPITTSIVAALQS